MRLALALALLLAWASAQAHKPSDSYLTLSAGDGALRGQWDIALRDLEYAIGLDADGDGAITWGELRARHAQIAAYALARLALHGDGRPCSFEAREHLVDEHSDGAYAVLRFAVRCEQAPQRSIEIGYSLFADLDPTHRGLVRVQHGATTASAMLGPDRPRLEVALGSELSEGPNAAIPTARVWLSAGRPGLPRTFRTSAGKTQPLRTVQSRNQEEA